MKNEIILYCLLLTGIGATAQRSKDSQLEDSIFSWKSIPTLNAKAYPRTFTQEQLKHPELFAQWLQQSYIPIGALDYSYALAEPNKKGEVQPYGTGINAAMWTAMWDNSFKKVIRQPHTENPIYLLSNNIIDAEPIPMLTVPGRSVFMRRSPELEKAFMGSSEKKNQFVHNLKLEQHPQIGNYLIQYYGCDGDGCMPRVAVYLTPDGRLPIRQLSRGEVLDLCEQAIPLEAEKAREKISGENRAYGAAAQQKWITHFNKETVPRWKSGIQKLRSKYANSLNEPAELKTSNGIAMINFYNGDDLFDTEDSHKKKLNTYGIYTYKEGILEKSRQNAPLWICISWTPTDLNNSPYAREIHRSMITHFNFEYVFNYFFQPEKVQHKPYTVLNEAVQRSHLVSYQSKKKEPVKKEWAPGIYFKEDFSGNTIGAKPSGWVVPTAGTASTITTVPGFSHNWVKLEQQRIMPNDPKKPLPENFKMEFDVATDKDFIQNTGGAFLLRIHNKILTSNGDYRDAPKQLFIDLDAKAGNEKFTQNPTGYTRLKVIYTGMPGALRYAAKELNSADFSNKKNIVHFTIVKYGKKVSAFIDGKEIIALDKNGKSIPGYNELPEDARFTSFYFENSSASQQVGVYLSNISITELK
jgi:hypothetical protein